MKMMKSLLLASAAGLIAAGGVQAADLPVKAKAIEYVKICSLYGAGFYYIPGTDTCIKLGGYLRADTVLGTSSDFDGATSGVAGARNRLSNYYTWRTRQDLQIDTRTATEYGVVRTFAELVFTWTSGTYAGAGTTAVNGSTTYTSSVGSAIAGGSLGVYYAFIQFAGFTFGKAESQFRTPWGSYAANNLEMPGAAGWDPVNQVSYTADFGQGITASFSLQDQVANYTTNIWNVSGATAAGIATGAYGANDIGGSRAPDLVARVRVDQAWGLFQASFAAHDNHAAYYGADETTGHPGDKWGWAGQVALSIKNLPTGPGDTINLTAVYTNGASRYNFEDFMPSTYAMYGGSGLAGAYQSLGFAGVSDSVFVTGAGQQLTTTYGFNGGYTHNWDPYWNTSVFGAWAAVRYNNTAKGYICGAVVATVALSSGLAGCNPDFNYAVIGTKTGWTPVKNLTFTGELAYVMLDQKFASGSTVTLPLQSGTAKPGAAYELKDQNSLVLLLRAQRSF
ncbi:porin [Bradyrhizobium sp. 4]|uniref:porin n=1 Tax=unclassified Bradyrhizobium TaxID=2631580 RepID=UPI001FF7A006|nr:MULTISPECIES: porin [unclassified Bradyrhizobium]MCK1402302.1 porin [Bradyrhizobium sp. 39]MCK1632598.1 porin [Bradyrhizobium sp. 162]MCK1750160.1 porin [Bradyrhizobium sp. 135]UPJ36393.1 porin [Bradyrhizobium sp. 4]